MPGGTGLWFVMGDRFKQWLSKANSILWLHGFAGCGKSVLPSTAIQYTFLEKEKKKAQATKSVGVAFFLLHIQRQIEARPVHYAPCFVVAARGAT